MTASTRSLSPATSCSILVSVSLIRISCPLASSRIRPFSKFKSRRTEACVRPISSRRRELSLARSAETRSWEERVSCASVESALRSSERSLAKSTFCVYVVRSESTRRAIRADASIFQHPAYALEQIFIYSGIFQGKRQTVKLELTLLQDHRSGQVLN